MVIDTSAFVAIFLGEPERQLLLAAVLNAENRSVSAANVLETGVVLEAKRGEAAGREFDLFLVRTGVRIVPVDEDQVEIARSAWRNFGKGRHRAGLNFGDCFAYALAKSSGDILLAKDEDFRLTDVELCPPE